jgi:RNA polymerase sigma factor (sigma-70 family)
MTTVPEDLLDLYFRELGGVALLTAEEEVQLAQRIEAGLEAQAEYRRRCKDDTLDDDICSHLEQMCADGDAAFDHFVRANLRLVVKEAGRYARRSSLELGELIQEGNLGLIRAVEKFDWRRGFRFSTYAIPWIRQALQRGTASKERAIRLPAGVHGNLIKVRAAETRLSAELDRPPCLDELAKATNLTENEVRHALSADFAVTSLDKPLTDEHDAAELGATLARSSDAPAEEVIDRIFAEGVLDLARKRLPERSWYVLQRRYGLDGYEPSTLNDVGKDLGVSREAVRKIEQRALAQLHGELALAA